ncbi:MAG: HAD family hydrolase, partial [Thermovirgaceae bacterium]
MIKLFVMDVDGTMTDGAVFLDGDGGEFKRFDVRDGLGVA